MVQGMPFLSPDVEFVKRVRKMKRTNARGRETARFLRLLCQMHEARALLFLLFLSTSLIIDASRRLFYIIGRVLILNFGYSMLSQTCIIVPKPSRIPVDVFSSCPNKLKHAPCSVCDRLSDLNNKFKETSIVYRKLIAQREGLISALNEEHDVIGTKLPDELLSEIFTHFCFSPPYYPQRALTVLDYGDPFASQSHARHLARNILTIRQVSRHWGNIALATPQLWVYIDLNVSFSNAMRTVHFLEEWLKRSKVLPIRIGLTFQNPNALCKCDRPRNIHTSCKENRGACGKALAKMHRTQVYRSE